MRPVQSTYIAALFKLHDHQIEAVQLDPEIKKQYSEVLLLRERLRMAMDQKNSRPRPWPPEASERKPSLKLMVALRERTY
jgi:hypothetical protein